MAGLSVYDGILRPEGGLARPDPQPDWNQFYNDVQGGYSQPNIVRTTPEGLNVRSTQTVAVDPFTGNPITASGSGNGYSAKNAGDVILNKPSAGKIASSGTINAANPLDVARLGLTVDLNDAAGVKAINGAAPIDVTIPLGQRPTGSAFGNGWGSSGILKFEPAVTGVGPEWSVADRHLSPPPMHPGLVTGRAPQTAAVLAARPASMAGSQVQAALAAQPGTSFLQAQGVDTSNMTAGQIANALNDNVRGAGAGQWH